MPVMRLEGGQPLPRAVREAARALPPGAPLLAMVHGYRYSPARPAHDPHRHILSPEARPGGVSWPRALGFAGDPAEGLALALGWEARGRLGAAYARAGLTGADLGPQLGRLADLAGRPVGLIGHSLGGRVALGALATAPPGAVGRIVLLNAAEFQDAAQAALDRPAGALAEVINVTARENDPFDFALEQLLARGRRRALGAGLGVPHGAWIELQIDDAAVLDALEALGFATARGARRMSHWTSYRREGLFAFYRAALCHPWALPLELLRHHLPLRGQPRWSRLLAGPSVLGGLRA